MSVSELWGTRKIQRIRMHKGKRSSEAHPVCICHLSKCGKSCWYNSTWWRCRLLVSALRMKELKSTTGEERGNKGKDSRRWMSSRRKIESISTSSSSEEEEEESEAEDDKATVLFCYQWWKERQLYRDEAELSPRSTVCRINTVYMHI